MSNVNVDMWKCRLWMVVFCQMGGTGPHNSVPWPRSTSRHVEIRGYLFYIYKYTMVSCVQRS